MTPSEHQEPQTDTQEVKDWLASLTGDQFKLVAAIWGL